MNGTESAVHQTLPSHWPLIWWETQITVYFSIFGHQNESKFSALLAALCRTTENLREQPKSVSGFMLGSIDFGRQ